MNTQIMNGSRFVRFFASICSLWAIINIPATGFASDPFGLLQLPHEFQSQRHTVRQAIPTGREITVAEFEGEGCLKHFWMTLSGIQDNPMRAQRLILRVYCDENDTPHVESPLASFFSIHHGHAPASVQSPFLQVTELGGFNCYFPMPYKNGLRITLENIGKRNIGVWFQADGHSYAASSLNEQRRFCAVYRRVNRAESYGQPYHVGHSTGRGQIVGLSLGMRVFDPKDRWYHCGGDLVLLDGGTPEARVISGIGGEDFFGNAWGMTQSANWSIGTPYYEEVEMPEEGKPHVAFAAYRFFDKDPIAFRHSFSFEFGSLENDISSVLYWYQDQMPDRFVEAPTVDSISNDTKVTSPIVGDAFDNAMTWDVVGPFPSANIDEFQASEFPEHKIDYEQMAPAEFGLYASKENLENGGMQTASWKRGAPSRFGFVDLMPYFRPRVTRNGGLPYAVSAYATTNIASEEAQTKRYLVSHDDAFRLWLNGKLIYDAKANKGFRVAEIELPLEQGDNRVLAKVANAANTNFRAWLFMLSPAK